MSTESGDEKAAGAAGHGHFRASHADRERVIDTLKAAFIQGRLTKDELELRVGQTLASRTYAELAALTGHPGRGGRGSVTAYPCLGTRESGQGGRLRESFPSPDSGRCVHGAWRCR